MTTASIIEIIRGLIKDLLNSAGRDSFQYESDNSFKLSEPRVSASSIIVYQNGTELPTSEWNYNADTNKVTLTMSGSGYSLTSGDDILITYDYFNKYSDTELTSYIKANLVRFTQYKYKKLFYMNSSDEIVTLNGENPTESEGNIIALVTAIDIDPQNIKIQTKDFTISPSEFNSKSEQIKNVISIFNKAYMSLDFLEIEA